MRIRAAAMSLLICSLVSVEVTTEANDKPTLTIASISPPEGSVIVRSTVLKVVLEYAVDEPGPAVALFVHPLFNSTESGQSFNALKRLSDGLPLKKGSGKIEYSYPITAEWDDRKLAKPILVTFCLMKQSGAGRADSIAETQPVSYQVSK